MDEQSKNPPKLQRFIELGWQLLEHKCRYYVHSDPSIEDYQYDMLEKEYDALANELGLPKSASDMVDFDEKRPSCQAVMRKIYMERRRNKKIKRKVKDENIVHD